MEMAALLTTKANWNSKIATYSLEENADSKTQELMDYFKINTMLFTVTTVQDHIGRSISNFSVFFILAIINRGM